MLPAEGESFRRSTAPAQTTHPLSGCVLTENMDPIIFILERMGKSKGNIRAYR
jgi:hypothetical protein